VVETKTLLLTLEEAVTPAEFRFDSYEPPLDTREIFPTKASWPFLAAAYEEGESIYVHYAVKNVGSGAGVAKIEVRDLDTGALITTYSVPSLEPNFRYKTSGDGAYVGKMPAKDWQISFKVTP